jgi:predicted metal-dependent hydrolase
MLSDVTIRPRQVRFDWAETPLHWVPGDPMSGHLIDVLHLLLPAGERWFVDVYRQVLPGIEDERLRAEVRGFMGQEAVHARAHAAVLDHLREHGIETAAYTRASSGCSTACSATAASRHRCAGVGCDTASPSSPPSSTSPACSASGHSAAAPPTTRPAPTR